MSTDYNTQQLLNTCYNNTRQLRADVDDQKARLDTLVEQMEKFREEATRLLTEMAQAHAPQITSEERN